MGEFGGLDLGLGSLEAEGTRCVTNMSRTKIIT